MCSYYSQDSQTIIRSTKNLIFKYIEKKKTKKKRDFHIITQDGDHNPRLLHKYIQHSVDADKKRFLLHKEVIIPA